MRSAPQPTASPRRRATKKRMFGAQRVDVEDVVAFRGIERFKIGIERGEEPNHVVLARALDSDGSLQRSSPRYYGRSFRTEAIVIETWGAFHPVPRRAQAAQPVRISSPVQRKDLPLEARSARADACRPPAARPSSASRA